MSPAAKAIDEAMPAARRRLEDFYELGRVLGLSKDEAQQLLAICKKLAKGADAIDIAETLFAIVVGRRT